MKAWIGILGLLAGCGSTAAGNVTEQLEPSTAAPANREASTNSDAPLHTETVRYHAGDTALVGYLAYDPSVSGPRPGVLVVHEWWGHNDYARGRAERLARMGYTALAVDMYGEGKQAAHPEDAQKFSHAVMSDLAAAEARFLAAKALLSAHETTAPEKMAAIGYCFGGGVVLHMARAGIDLDLVASFHGMLAPQRTAEPGVVKAKVLAFHGAADPFVSADAVTAFQAEMENAGVDLTFTAYPDVKHAFTNPAATAMGERFNLPLVYNEAADTASWAALSEHLSAVFQ